MADDFSRRVVVAIISLTTLIGVVNFAIDPEDRLSFETLGWLKPYKHIPLMSAPAKVSLLRKLKCERILVGSSRVELALDPDDPHWSDLSTCNLGISGSSIFDQIKVIETALASQSIREIIWALDFQSFGKKHIQIIEQQHKTLLFSWFSWNTLNKSMGTLLRAWRNDRNGYNQNGFLSRPKFQALSSTRFQNDVRNYSKDRALYLGYKLDPRSFEEIARIRNRLTASGISLRFVILPVHAVHWEILHLTHLEEEYSSWIKQIIQSLGPILTFGAYDFPNEEVVPKNYQKMRWFWDSNHITKEYGSLIIAEMYSAKTSFAIRHKDITDYLDSTVKEKAYRSQWRSRNLDLLTRIGLP